MSYKANWQGDVKSILHMSTVEEFKKVVCVWWLLYASILGVVFYRVSFFQSALFNYEDDGQRICK